MAWWAAWKWCPERPRRTAPASASPRAFGGVKQRWHIVPTHAAFQLQAITTGNCLEVSNSDDGAALQQGACTGADTQSFLVTGLSHDTQIVAKHSGLFVGVASGETKAPALIQRPCTADGDQTWRLQRSSFR